MSVPYTEDADPTTDGTKHANHTNLKTLRVKQRSRKERYEYLPRALDTHTLN